jgi:hypothetical protein
MVKVEIKAELEIHQAFRIVTTQAMREDVNHIIEDAGAGMTNVYMTILGYDQSILQCYPNGEFDCVYIVIPKDAEEHSIEIGDLPEFLQREIFNDYCLELKRITS